MWEQHPFPVLLNVLHSYQLNLAGIKWVDLELYLTGGQGAMSTKDENAMLR